ncbi:HK97-gp10 family putative phage morphogenesis protein [Paracoccus sp. ME4]|uniref:HK97-gp10 family putative phage morphogenesis protein n=1 Tax=Paracoccus sp. ME4 TaxID=3138066 RepID=UPI00398BB339
MFRRKAAAVRAAAKLAAQQSGDEVASAMRYLAPSDKANLRRSIRVEDATSVKLAGQSRAAYASRQGNQSARDSTNRTADFIGVLIRAGDTSTLVPGARNTLFQNARLQEFGTQSMPANPFFFPAWRANRSRVRSKLTRAVKNAWVK